MLKRIGIILIINLILIYIVQIETNCIYAENSGTTYYVSATGISKDGTNINDPMSLKVANSRLFLANDKVLFKCGDTFYGTINFNIKSEDGNMFYIGSYGDGEKPIISGANILINRNAWILEDGLYKIDLSNYDNFQGIGKTNWEPYNIGFISDETGNIHGNRKRLKNQIRNDFDFYCENNYLYIKCNSNPSDELGKIKFVSRNNLIYLASNTILDGLNVENTGAHGIVKKLSEIHNVIIQNCIIQNIGGSVQIDSSYTRYGNGIEFWNQGSNIVIKNNIVRNTYDAGFTIQGNTVTTGFENVECYNNIFDSCTYPIEIFCGNNNKQKIEIGIKNCNIYSNIIVNQARGWGYVARPDKFQSSNYVIWNLEGKYKQINIYNNVEYNSLNDLYLYPPNTTLKDIFKQNVILDYNKVFMDKECSLINRNGSYTDRKVLSDYDFEQNSQFSLINTESEEFKEINEIAGKSNDIDEIRSIVLYNTGIYKKDGTISIKYVNLNDNKEIKEVKNIKGLKLGTYGVVARDIEGYKVIGNSSSIITLDEVNNSFEIIFRYTTENITNTDTSMWINGSISVDEKSEVELLTGKNIEFNVSSEIQNKIETMKSTKIESSESDNQDNTIINGILPNTGKEIILNLIIIIIIFVSIYSGIEYYKIKKQTNKQI